jgi:hypothetical protein
VTTVEEHRATLAASLASAVATLRVKPVVHSVPFSDPVPPCIMIGNVAYEVMSRTCTVTWPIQVYVPRTTPEQIVSDFDSIIPPILTTLAKGAGIAFVVSSAVPRPSTPELPIGLPEYVIVGTTTIPLC